MWHLITSQKNSFPLSPQNQEIHDTSSELLMILEFRNQNLWIKSQLIWWSNICITGWSIVLNIDCNDNEISADFFFWICGKFSFIENVPVCFLQFFGANCEMHPRVKCPKLSVPFSCYPKPKFKSLWKLLSLLDALLLIS